MCGWFFLRTRKLRCRYAYEFVIIFALHSAGFNVCVIFGFREWTAAGIPCLFNWIRQATNGPVHTTAIHRVRPQQRGSAGRSSAGVHLRDVSDCTCVHRL